MALPRQWSYPATTTAAVSVTTDVVTQSAPTGGPGFNLAADTIQVPTMITAPPVGTSSASVIPGTPIQNPFGYDAVLSTFVQVVSASVATIAFGVGSASTSATPAVATTTVVSNVSGSNLPYSFPMYVPAGYWAELTISQPSGAATASVNAVWQPV